MTGKKIRRHNRDCPRKREPSRPLPVGRVEQRHGLTFVYAPAPGGFRVGDYLKVPDENRIELWDGMLVVYPERDRRTRSLIRYFYELLEHMCEGELGAFIGPLDVPISRTTVFAPEAPSDVAARRPPSRRSEGRAKSAPPTTHYLHSWLCKAQKRARTLAQIPGRITGISGGNGNRMGRIDGIPAEMMMTFRADDWRLKCV